MIVFFVFSVGVRCEIESLSWALVSLVFVHVSDHSDHSVVSLFSGSLWSASGMMVSRLLERKVGFGFTTS